MRGAQDLDVLKEWVQNLIQVSEAEVRLELRPSGTQHANACIRCVSCHDVKKDGLACSGGTEQEESVAVERRRLDERAEELEMLVASE
jgi:hypothetical protein